MTAYDMRIARAWMDEEGNWWLSVAGTDIEKKYLWHEEDLTVEAFPGNSLGHRLIELGWMPDRRAMYGALSMSQVERLTLVALAGWRPAGEHVWVIPCYRKRE